MLFLPRRPRSVRSAGLFCFNFHLRRRSMPVRVMKIPFRLSLAVLMVCCAATAQQPTSVSGANQPVPVAIVGLVHQHVIGWFAGLKSHPEIALVGVSEPDASLRAKYAAQFGLPQETFFASEAEMLAHTQPRAVLVYTSIADHRRAIEMAAEKHIASMVEKPLATTMEDTLAIRDAAAKYHVPVLVNYETTWYANNHEAKRLADDGKLGELRRIVVHDGHRGPKEIGVGPEFLSWLTDPVQNGAGALFDFGCYGADLSTWLMHGEEPLTVTAVTQHDKPGLYPHVDDDATVVLTYPHAVTVIQASWNWPFDRKDMEVYGATGYADTVYVDYEVRDRMMVRELGATQAHPATAPALPADEDDSVHYLVHVLQSGEAPRGDLSALDTNVTVMKILTAARESARTGRTVTLSH